MVKQIVQFLHEAMLRKEDSTDKIATGETRTCQSDAGEHDLRETRKRQVGARV
jgi:hypothetical protein